jgi:signal transduction histidine kinase
METIRNVNFLDALLPMAVIIFIIGMGVVLLNQHFQKNLTAQKLQQEALKAVHQNDLLRSSIFAQEEERKRIAQDLHDEVGSIISIMRMHLVIMEGESAAPTGDAPTLQGTITSENAAPTLAGLQNVRRLSDTALASIHSISHQLMPPQLESFGLTDTLKTLVGPIGKAGGLSIDIGDPASTRDLSWIINLALYRIIMELINNTIRHAEAGQVTISIHRDNRHVICHYNDDGNGLPGKYSGKGLGHKSIEGRVRALEGLLEMGNGPAGGFSAIIRIPLDAK